MLTLVSEGKPVQSRIRLADGAVSVEDTYITNLYARGINDVSIAGPYKLMSITVKKTLADVSASAPCVGELERILIYRMLTFPL